MATSIKKVFYADNGCLGGNEFPLVQHALDLIMDCFSRVGLFLNPSKTVSMSTWKCFRAVHKDVRALLKEQLGETYEQWSTIKMVCPLCNQKLKVCLFARHCRHIHPNDNEPILSNLLYTPVSEAPSGTEFRTFWYAIDGTNC